MFSYTLQIYITSDKHTVHHTSVFYKLSELIGNTRDSHQIYNSPIYQIKVITMNISHPIGHDEVDGCTLLSTVCQAAEGVPRVLLGRQFHTVHQDTVLTRPMALMILAMIKTEVRWSMMWHNTRNDEGNDNNWLTCMIRLRAGRCRGFQGTAGARDFPLLRLFRLNLGPTQPPIKWVPGLLPDEKVVRVWCWPPTPI